MTKLVTILGGSGFVGHYVARRMAQAGWRVRVATRRPNEHLDVRTMGVVGQVEPVFCNIRDDDSVRAAVLGADAAVNCAGILFEHGKNSFAAVMDEGAGRAARIAAEEGAGQFVHLSAIGANAESESLYQRSKAAGEAAVLAEFPGAVILRPSIIFGTEDQFFNRFAAMTRFTPVLPIAHAETRFQPVYIDDVAQAAVRAAMGQVARGVYELGGPDIETFRQLMQRMLVEIHRKRVIVNMPNWMARLVAGSLDLAQVLSGGLFTNSILTRDQLAALAHDNVVAEGAMGLAKLGIDPTPMDLVLPTYLWRFRPNGQYDAIRESAKSLHGV